MVLFFFPQFPGAENLVRHFHKHGVPMALASGSDTHNFELKTRNHQDLFRLFTHTVLSSSDPEVTHGKPAPDCFLVCAARFAQPPSKPENVSHLTDGDFVFFAAMITVVVLFLMFGFLFFTPEARPGDFCYISPLSLGCQFDPTFLSLLSCSSVLPSPVALSV